MGLRTTTRHLPLTPWISPEQPNINAAETAAEQQLGTDIRTAYWLAGASNALAGALLHQASLLADATTPPARRVRAAASAGHWLRILRRADTMWG